MVNNSLNKRPDVFVGIVSFVGIDTKLIISLLKANFEDFDYEPIHIKISGVFREFDERFHSRILENISERSRKRTEKYIDFGNKIREAKGNDFLAQYAVSEIIKKNETESNSKPKAYIIDQLKTADELNLLKSIYGKAFFQISIYSARDRRVDYLAKLKAKAEDKRDSNPYRAEAEDLVNKDYNENESHGQKTGKIFPLADAIINTDDKEEHSVESQVKRFVKLLFGSNKYSPNHMEYGMYLAHSAALRSLDLSRQVGAAIFRPTGEIATLGCNELPKTGGGTYWTDEKYDAREYTKGSDSNDARKNELLHELETILKDKLDETEKEALEKTIERKEKELRDSQFMDALEYGRIVHAEMNAITDAARHGIPLRDATLYCTTFPCHICSKHIIAAGLKHVIFLEPYPKSLTSDMHPDSVKIEGTGRGQYGSYPFVEFTHFFGITAHRYYEFFHRSKRKNEETGKFQNYKDGKHLPIFAPNPPSYTAAENSIWKDANIYYNKKSESSNTNSPIKQAVT